MTDNPEPHAYVFENDVPEGASAAPLPDSVYCMEVYEGINATFAHRVVPGDPADSAIRWQNNNGRVGLSLFWRFLLVLVAVLFCFVVIAKLLSSF